MYVPGQTPEQYFEEILSLAFQQGKNAFDLIYSDNHKNRNVIKILIEELPTAINQIMFEMYYVLYLLLEEKHSIYYYYKERVDKAHSELNIDDIPKDLKQYYEIIEKYRHVNFKDDADHNKIQRDYKTFRNDMDISTIGYYNIVNLGIYEKIKDNYVGHKLRKLDYLFLERMLEDDKIEYLFDALMGSRLSNNKKVSNTDFYESIIPAIQKMYDMIEETDYVDNGNVYKGAMLRSIDYYQFEKNCSVELCYMASYALAKIKKPLEDKQRDREIFHKLRWSELVINGETHYIQNKAVSITNRVFSEYIDGNIDAYEVRDIYAGLNSIIYISLYSCLKIFFGGSFSRPLSSKYWIDIFQNGEKLKPELGSINIDDFMCSDTELFFKTYIGAGQHINKKIWKVIKTKDFREMYEIL